MSQFDPDELRPLIIARKGDVRSIADEIGADSEELRSFIGNTPLLRRALEEVVARGVDQAISILFRGLDDDSYGNQLAAAKEFLKSRPAQRRGFHHAGDLELKMPSGKGALTLTWLPPEEPHKPEPPMIEGTANEE